MWKARFTNFGRLKRGIFSNVYSNLKFNNRNNIFFLKKQNKSFSKNKIVFIDYEIDSSSLAISFLDKS